MRQRFVTGLALLALAAGAWAQTPVTAPVTVSVSPATFAVGATGKYTVTITNTAAPVVTTENVATNAVLTYTDADGAKTVSAGVTIGIQRERPGSDWGSLAFAPVVPAPLTADWNTLTFAGGAVNPRLDTTGLAPTLRADRLPGGETWIATFTLKNP